MTDPISAALPAIGTAFLSRILPTVLIALLCLVAIRVIMTLVDRLFVRLKVPATVVSLLRTVVKVVLLFLGVLIVLSYLGIPVTSLIAAMSIVGVALSLGIQNFLSNVVGGFQLIASRPFEVGDYVEAGGCSGVVKELGLFYTKILTPDNKLIQMPNSSVVAANITNYSSEPTRRVDLTVSASYDSPVEQVEETLGALLTGHEKVLPDPAPFARVSAYGASAIEYTVRVWCNTDDYWDVYFDLTKGIKTAFDQAGVEMTYPHMNVHIMEKKDQTL